MDLVTKRLILISCSVEMLKSLIDNTIDLTKLIGVRVPRSWPPEELQEAAPYFINVLNESPEMLGKLNWFIVEKPQNIVIGSIGFKTKPDKNGAIEIGFGIDLSYRRKGYATEAIEELMNWAFLQNDIQKIIAECEVKNKPSIRVLEKIHMQKIAVQKNMIKWELKSRKAKT